MSFRGDRLLNYDFGAYSEAFQFLNENIVLIDVELTIVIFKLDVRVNWFDFLESSVVCFASVFEELESTMKIRQLEQVMSSSSLPSRATEMPQHLKEVAIISLGSAFHAVIIHWQAKSKDGALSRSSARGFWTATAIQVYCSVIRALNERFQTTSPGWIYLVHPL